MSVPLRYLQPIRDIHESFHNGNPISAEELMGIMGILCPSEQTVVWETYRSQCPMNVNTFLTLMYELHKGTGMQYEEMVWNYIKGSLKRNLFNGQESADMKVIRSTLDPLMRSVRLDVQSIYNEHVSPDSDGHITVNQLCNVFKAMHAPGSTVYVEMYKWARANKVEKKRESIAEPSRVFDESIRTWIPSNSTPSQNSIPENDLFNLPVVAVETETATSLPEAKVETECKTAIRATSAVGVKSTLTPHTDEAAELATEKEAHCVSKDLLCGVPGPRHTDLRFGPPLDFLPSLVRDLEPPPRGTAPVPRAALRSRKAQPPQENTEANDREENTEKDREAALLNAVLARVSAGAPVDPLVTVYLRELRHQERALREALREELESLTAAMSACDFVRQRLEALRTARRAKCFDRLESRRSALLNKMAAFVESATQGGKGPQCVARDNEVDAGRRVCVEMERAKRMFSPNAFRDESPAPQELASRAVHSLPNAAKALSKLQGERKIEERLLAHIARAGDIAKSD